MITETIKAKEELREEIERAKKKRYIILTNYQKRS